ncbi:MAG TPA: AEC family transporter [Candidatus Avidehalobacter gallistercoris]|uniref:AEC family transporter n=1 Tax=Candidatus Avidehalobacter gallistercoris TaxID=2840694 RepID=A0A9D1HJQ2_9FIRM|nr:AEC family transporter [Candidatus Avidehalobacter gallistercoris]
MSFLMIFQQMLMLLLMMLIGYIMEKKYLLGENSAAVMSKIVLNVTLPAQIITSFSIEGADISAAAVGKTLGFSALAYAFYFVVAWLMVRLLRAPKEQRGTYEYMVIFGNVGFMGFPLITTVFGADKLVYAVLFNIVFNLLVFSVGIQMIAGGSGSFDWRRLINLPLGSSVLALLLFFAHIELPGFVNTALFTLGDATTPLAMLILGATIAAMPIRELFEERRVYLFVAVKLLAVPVLVLLLIKPLLPAGDIIGSILVVLSGMPVATNATMLSVEYGGDIKLVSQGIFFTTVLSVLTIPLLIAVLG